MYRGAVQTPNYTNWIFASNKSDPVSIDREDRRFNVGKYQPNRLVMTDKELDQIDRELQAFHDYLMNHRVDYDAVHTPLNNAHREALMDLSESSGDAVANALLAGRMEFFIDQLPTDESSQHSDMQRFNKVENYKKVLIDLLARTDRNTGKCNVACDELRTIFEYTVGNIPDTPNKFTSFLGHRRIRVTKVWIQTRTVNGIAVVWVDVAHFKNFDQILTPAKTASTPKLTKVK